MVDCEFMASPIVDNMLVGLGISLAAAAVVAAVRVPGLDPA